MTVSSPQASCSITIPAHWSSYIYAPYQSLSLLIGQIASPSLDGPSSSLTFTPVQLVPLIRIESVQSLMGWYGDVQGMGLGWLYTDGFDESGSSQPGVQLSYDLQAHVQNIFELLPKCHFGVHCHRRMNQSTIVNENNMMSNLEAPEITGHHYIDSNQPIAMIQIAWFRLDQSLTVDAFLEQCYQVDPFMISYASFMIANDIEDSEDQQPSAQQAGLLPANLIHNSDTSSMIFGFDLAEDPSYQALTQELRNYEQLCSAYRVLAQPDDLLFKRLQAVEVYEERKRRLGASIKEAASLSPRDVLKVFQATVQKQC